MKKSFIITIDTESDNQWDYTHSQSIENVHFIPRFQSLCEKYNFKPVYLVDYSMAQSQELIDFLNNRLAAGNCEVGMHLHAWDTPPSHEYDIIPESRSYLIEYPMDVMEEKIATMSSLLRNSFSSPITSHRAGRWATDERYLSLLAKYGYKVDCSYTPGINWSSSKGAINGGSDYSSVISSAKWLSGDLLEVPMTVSKLHCIDDFKIKELPKEIIKGALGRNVWLRPALSSNKLMNCLVKSNVNDYLEFMMHSSELMPGGSPYFISEADIERMYSRLEDFFSEVSKEYAGCTLQEYYDLKWSEKEGKE